MQLEIDIYQVTVHQYHKHQSPVVLNKLWFTTRHEANDYCVTHNQYDSVLDPEHQRATWSTL